MKADHLSPMPTDRMYDTYQDLLQRLAQLRARQIKIDEAIFALRSYIESTDSSQGPPEQLCHTRRRVIRRCLAQRTL